MVQGERWEGGSGQGTGVHPWQIHVDVQQNQQNILKLNKIKFKKINKVKLGNIKKKRKESIKKTGDAKVGTLEDLNDLDTDKIKDNSTPTKIT